MSGLHFRCAASNAGDCGSTPAPPSWTPIPPPGPLLTVGSGKFGTPCDRMHCAILSAFAFTCAIPPGSAFGLGMYFWQVFIADWKAGALTGTPLTVIVCPWPLRCEDWIWSPPPPLAPGSGKFGTPWERMQLANCSPALLRDAEEGS